MLYKSEISNKVKLKFTEYLSNSQQAAAQAIVEIVTKLNAYDVPKKIM